MVYSYEISKNSMDNFRCYQFRLCIQWKEEVFNNSEKGKVQVSKRFIGSMTLGKCWPMSSEGFFRRKNIIKGIKAGNDTLSLELQLIFWNHREGGLIFDKKWRLF